MFYISIYLECNLRDFVYRVFGIIESVSGEE